MKLKPAKPEEAAPASRFLVVQTAKGRVYVEASESRVGRGRGGGRQGDAAAAAAVPYARRDGQGRDEGHAPLPDARPFVGPSYRIDITDPKSLALEQHAVIRNELANLDGAEVRLISGYPSVQFAHVRSLLAPRTSLAAFFAELGEQRPLARGRWDEQFRGHSDRPLTTTGDRGAARTRGDTGRRRRGPALPADRQADARRRRHLGDHGREGEGGLRADRRVARRRGRGRVRPLRSPRSERGRRRPGTR